MNKALVMLEHWFPESTAPFSAEEAVAEAQKEIRRLLLVERHRDVLAMHMAEVKAIADGKSHNTLQDVVEHCLEEIGKLNLSGKAG